ncbi:hypothetical protein [Chromohalobacter japonicus]|uniref:hypothetical protein n=2 Tax=Chromohalobacter japonicus TaxID=223900 RepID=UPI0035E98796
MATRYLMGYVLHLVIETALVEVALDRLEDWKKERLEFNLPVSGGDEVFKYLVPIHNREKTDAHYILDGDKVAKVDIDLKSIPAQDGESIYQSIKNAYKCEPLHLSRDDRKGCLEYVERVQQRVHYLNATCPEIVFLELIQNDKVDHLTNEEAKSKLVEILDNRKLGSTAKDQHTLFNLYLRENAENKYIAHIASILDAIAVN